jgi:hypothetical protein
MSDEFSQNAPRYVKARSNSLLYECEMYGWIMHIAAVDSSSVTVGLDSRVVVVNL